MSYAFAARLFGIVGTCNEFCNVSDRMKQINLKIVATSGHVRLRVSVWERRSDAA